MTDREFLKRVNDHIKKKEDKVKKWKEEQAKEAEKECTFTPTMYTKSYVSNHQQRDGNEKDKKKDLQAFLDDQSRYMEHKEMNTKKMQQELRGKEIDEVKKAPEIDILSKQIVEMMVERKNQPTYDRLYQSGKDKLREISEQEKNPSKALSENINAKTSQVDPNRRGKPIQEALYEMHKEHLKNNELKKLENEMKEAMKVQAAKFVNSDNDQIRINGFKREFRLMLSKTLNLAPQKSQVSAAGSNNSSGAKPQSAGKKKPTSSVSSKRVK